MDTAFPNPRSHRGKDLKLNGVIGRGRGQSKNKTWIASDGHAGPRNPSAAPGVGGGHHGADGERWERGSAFRRGRARGMRRGNRTLHVVHTKKLEDEREEDDGMHTEGDGTYTEAEDMGETDIDEPELETPEERERFYQEVRLALFVLGV